MAGKEKRSLFDRIFRRNTVKVQPDNDYCEPVDALEGTSMDDALRKTLRSLMSEVYPEFKDKFYKYAPEGATELSLFRVYCNETGVLSDACFDNLQAFIRQNGVDLFGREFEDAFIDITQNFRREQAAQKEFEEEFKHFSTPAKNLPNGWEWVKFNDGSGSLESPSGESCFSYDLSPYALQGWIEYQRTEGPGWDVFQGFFDEFAIYAEEIVAKERSFLGRFDVPGITGMLANNAWNGIEPNVVRLVAGDNVIVLEGYIYEPSYECFSATSSVSLNGEVMFGVDSRNVDAYKNEVYQMGRFENIEDAVAYIREQIDGLEIYLDEAPEAHQDKSVVADLLLDASAVAEKNKVFSEVEKNNNAVAFEK